MQVEITGGVQFFTVNYDFYQGKTRSQAPIGSIQGHINYNFKKGIWAALDGTYYWAEVLPWMMWREKTCKRIPG